MAGEADSMVREGTVREGTVREADSTAREGTAREGTAGEADGERGTQHGDGCCQDMTADERDKSQAASCISGEGKYRG